MGTALVIGANRGIGLELCRQLKARGEQVIAACRRSSPELEDLGVRIEVGVDIGSGEAVAGLARRLERTPIHLLVHSAGVVERHGLDANIVDSIRRQFEINALGPLRVTAALAPNLAPGAKIAILTSRLGSISENTSGGSYGYRMSKAALNMAGVSLAHDLRPRGISVALLHPGFVRTELTGQRGDVDPPEAVRGLLARIDELTPATSGGFWHANGTRLPF